MDRRLDDVYAPRCHPRSRVGNVDTSLRGSECPVCFSCFLVALADFDCRGYPTLADLVGSGDRWDGPGIHLTVWMADPFACECPTCGGHGQVSAAVLEICSNRLVCRPCVAEGHDARTEIPPHTGTRWSGSRQSRGPTVGRRLVYAARRLTNWDDRIVPETGHESTRLSAGERTRCC